jgi:hypothetical protein
VIAETTFEREEADRFPIDSPEGAGIRQAFARYVVREADREGLRPWEFWRTIRVKPLLLWARLDPRVGDDPGRQRLLVMGFRLLGSLAPLLPLWLGSLFALPLLVWTSFELARAGFTPAALAFPLLFGSSPFVIEVLSLPYSAVGFYLLALLSLTPLALYVLGARRSLRGLAVRVSLAGIFFALCVLCRAGSVLVGPAFALAILIAVRRAFPGDFLRAAGAGLLLLLLFALPYGALRGREHRRPWIGIWEGLGDFDREKGHEFYDPVAREALRREGVKLPADVGLGIETPDNDAVFKRLVLRDILESPGWYLAIIGKRLAAVPTQAYLWHRAGQESGSRPSDVETKVYYGMASTADVLGVGPLRVRIPFLLFALPTLVLLVSGVGPSREGSRRACGVLGLLALGALGMPVFVSTASALETEAFCLVLLLGDALAFAELLKVVRPFNPAGARSRAETDSSR